MVSGDSAIDRLVLKWATDENGTWNEVTKDLINFKKQIQENTLKGEIEVADSQQLCYNEDN
jgi:hypothetical protein